jgi:hypothetical protein
MRRVVPGLLLAPLLAAAGCIVGVDRSYPDGSYPPPSDGAQLLGALGVTGYHVIAGAGAEVPGGDLGYVVTANGAGGYRVAWTDTAGSLASFHGTITTDGEFDSSQLYALGGAYVTQAAANRVEFDSVPGANIDGVDLVSSTDPIYVDARLEGSRSGFGIWFANAYTSTQHSSPYDPVAFTSP